MERERGRRVNVLEAWRHVHGHVLVTLFETVVLLDVVQVVATNDDGTLHLLLDHNSLQDTSADADGAGERALLVDVRAFDRITRGLESETDITPETLLADLDAGALLRVQEDVRLLLESTLILFVSKCKRKTNLN
jgi:hypothetical protein